MWKEGEKHLFFAIVSPTILPSQNRNIDINLYLHIIYIYV